VTGPWADAMNAFVHSLPTIPAKQQAFDEAARRAAIAAVVACGGINTKGPKR
jgi:hypothetical protein